jgi:6-pyruvoyl-tetrahydropterin synthase related domain
MLFLGNASGHDFQFHIASWMDVAGQWREGIAFPRWAQWANWGFGEPRFIFYPPASWMLGAALGAVLPWKIVPGVFIWLALIGAGMSMWQLAREWLPARHAIVAAVLFEVNPYHLVIVYYRSDFAELLALALLPLVLWALLRAMQNEGRLVPLLALLFGGIWISNAPAAVISTYSLALILILVCALRRSLRPLVPGALAMLGGFGLAAFYILPAAWERRWVQIAQAVADSLAPARNFLFTRANDPDFMAFNSKVSWVAVPVIFVTLVAASFVTARRKEFPELFWVLAALAVVSMALMLPITGFVWRFLPEIRYVQFPWRWLGPLGVAFAFFVAAALSAAQRRWLGWIACVALFAAIAAAAAAMIRTAWWDTGDVPALAAAIHSGGGYRGTDEYDPIGCDRYELPGDPDDTERTEGVSAVPAQPVEQLDPDSGDVVPVSEAQVGIQSWSAERREFSVNTEEPVTLAVRLLNYPAWDVRVDGKGIAPGKVPDTGQMLVPLSPGAHVVSIRFRPTWDRTAGDAISILSAFLLLGIFWRTRKPLPRA